MPKNETHEVDMPRRLGTLKRRFADPTDDPAPAAAAVEPYTFDLDHDPFSRFLVGREYQVTRADGSVIQATVTKSELGATRFESQESFLANDAWPTNFTLTPEEAAERPSGDTEVQ